MTGLRTLIKELTAIIVCKMLHIRYPSCGTADRLSALLQQHCRRSSRLHSCVTPVLMSRHVKAGERVLCVSRWGFWMMDSSRSQCRIGKPSSLCTSFSSHFFPVQPSPQLLHSSASRAQLIVQLILTDDNDWKSLRAVQSLLTLCSHPHNDHDVVSIRRHFDRCGGILWEGYSDDDCAVRG